MEWLFVVKGLSKAVLLPPLNGLVLIALGAVLRERRWARRAAIGGFLLLLLQSMPLVADLLLRPLEHRAGPPPATAEGAQAIVILAGGVYRDAPEFFGDSANSATLERARYGAILAKRFNLPVFASGGAPDGLGAGEGAALASLLTDELAVPVRWVEAASFDTRDQARAAKRLLAAAGISRVLLVTHAYHLPRARLAFEAEGLLVVPGPTVYKAHGPNSLFYWVPSVRAMEKSYLALHEWIGIVWYVGVDRWHRARAWGDATINRTQKSPLG